MSTELSLDALGNGVFELRFRRPERMNALGVATVAAFQDAVRTCADQRARVMLITGTGRAFCAGADLKERTGMDLDGKLAHNAGIRAAIEAVGSAKFVTIAVLNGVALGGGLELALACDLRVAAAGVSLGLTESRVGAFPGAGGTQRLPRLIGVSRALQMMLTGEPVTAERAQEIGLVNEVVAPDALDARARALAAVLGSRSAPALANMKRLAYRGIELPLADGLALEREALPGLFASADYAEGITAFAEKRAPQFKDTVQ